MEQVFIDIKVDVKCERSQSVSSVAVSLTTHDTALAPAPAPIFAWCVQSLSSERYYDISPQLYIFLQIRQNCLS